MIILRSTILRVRNVWDKTVDKIKTHVFLFNNIFPLESRVVYEITWKNIVESDRSQMTIWRMHTAYWIPKSAKAHSEYVILIACPLQQLLQERVSMLYDTYIVCLITYDRERTQNDVMMSFYNVNLHSRVLVNDLKITIQRFSCDGAQKLEGTLHGARL